MIDFVIAFALGAIVTGLLALAALPVLWWRAQRITRRQLEAEMPLSLQEVRAGRDLIRAEAAFTHRRLEQAIAEEQARRAAHLADLARAGEHARTLEATLANDERIAAEKDKEIRRLHGLEEELAATRTDLLALSSEALSVRQRSEAGEMVVHANRIEVAALVTRNGVLEDRLRDALRHVDELIAAGVERDGRIALQAVEIGRRQAALSSAGERLAEQERTIAALHDGLDQAEEERMQAWGRIQSDNDDLRAALKQVSLDIARAAMAQSGHDQGS